MSDRSKAVVATFRLHAWWCGVVLLVALATAGCGGDGEASSLGAPDGGGASDAASDDQQARAPVTLSGFTFAFVGSTPVAGAIVSIAEDPSTETTSADDGSYELTVSGLEAFTPVVRHADFVEMHLQTFTATGEGLSNVNFQMVTPAVFDGLAAVLQVDPDPQRCQIASTVNTKEIRDLTLTDFAAFGPHGVAGATVESAPSGLEAVYFNASVIPDRSLTETSEDGGVVWPNVEPGKYELSAAHPTRSFDAFVADCQPGRLINAGPPWGLRER